MVVQRHGEEILAIGEEQEGPLRAGDMRLDLIDQGAQLAGKGE